ncbi:hypothetical protein C8J57DRAFT_1461548 [Mycena rebaudengoi]|nr:hypothetical protein C8J57DRAFT_1461548 [Mycena rebaudengoi]
MLSGRTMCGWPSWASFGNFFVNANAGVLRANFVAHEGKKELGIVAEGGRHSLDFGEMSRQMVDLMEKNLTDLTLREWALPNFTTTTINDITVSAIVMMATLKAYFNFVWEKSDWQKVAHYDWGGSGSRYYSGWIGAFCVFSKKGVWIGNKLNTGVDLVEAPESLTAKEFWAAYQKPPEFQPHSSSLNLDLRRWTLSWMITGEMFDCVMTAGLVATEVTSSNDLELSSTGEDDTVHPVAGWWIFVQKPVDSL